MGLDLQIRAKFDFSYSSHGIGQVERAFKTSKWVSQTRTLCLRPENFSFEATRYHYLRFPASRSKRVLSSVSIENGPRFGRRARQGKR